MSKSKPQTNRDGVTVNWKFVGAYLDNDYMITQLPLVLMFYDSIPSSVAQEVQLLTIVEQVYYTFDGHLT